MSPSTTPLPSITGQPGVTGQPGSSAVPVPPGDISAPDSGRPVRRRRSYRGAVVGTLALLIGVGIIAAPHLPPLNGVTTAWTSFLPWTAVPLVLLALLALIRRAWWGLSAVIVAVMVWSAVFVPQMLPAKASTVRPDLTVATQNIGAANPDQAAAAAALVASGAGVVGVQEIVGPGGGSTGASAGAASVLDAAYGFHARVSTVGLWSKWAMDDPEPLTLGLSWARAFRTVVHHPDGDIAVYLVHLPSVRPGYTASRNAAVGELAALVAADKAGRVLVLGDLNTASTDPTLQPLTEQLTDSRSAVGGGFGFTWPSGFPATRPDHVLGRGVTLLSDQVLAAQGSDHRAVLVGVRLG